MNTAIQDFLEQNTTIVPFAAANGFPGGEQYRSKTDGSYMGLVGLSEQDREGMWQFFIDHGIAQFQNANGVSENSANIGFSEKEQKWYGWSHRAIYGFGIGSEVKRGDCAYMPVDKEDFLQDMVRFWSDPGHINVEGRHGKHEDGSQGVFVDWEYDTTVPNEKLHGTISGCFQKYPDEWGKGEWTAQSLEDAKQMACDFANSVS